jgi:hemolysin-activating ACP:hemolysin acyltransferase
MRLTANARRQSLMFAEAIIVMMRSPQFKWVTIGEIESLVMPAISTGQFRFARMRSHAKATATPIGAMLWASVSDDVDRRIRANLDQPIRLAPGEWRDGPHVWLMALAGDPKVTHQLLTQVHDGLPGKPPIMMRVRGIDSKPTIGTFPSMPEATSVVLGA